MSATYFSMSASVYVCRCICVYVVKAFSHSNRCVTNKEVLIVEDLSKKTKPTAKYVNVYIVSLTCLRT